MDRQHLMKIGMLAVAAVALIYIISLYSKKAESKPEYFTDNDEEEISENYEDDTETPVEHFTGTGVQGVSSDVTYEPVNAGDEDSSQPKDCFPKDQLTPGELLPSGDSSKWSASVPTGQGELGDQNFLTAGYHVGVNTVGQTLRNANRQIRSEPSNPQLKVSPWLQSTIESDTNRKPLEIGGCQN
jgi:hypothetical protein